MYLCPNHHRYANMLQIIIDQNGLSGDRKAEEFALKNFDADFNEKVLRHLIGAHIGEAAEIADAEEWGEPRKVSKKVAAQMSRRRAAERAKRNPLAIPFKLEVSWPK